MGGTGDNKAPCQSLTGSVCLHPRYQIPFTRHLFFGAFCTLQAAVFLRDTVPAFQSQSGSYSITSNQSQCVNPQDIAMLPSSLRRARRRLRVEMNAMLVAGVAWEQVVGPFIAAPGCKHPAPTSAHVWVDGNGWVRRCGAVATHGLTHLVIDSIKGIVETVPRMI